MERSPLSLLVWLVVFIVVVVLLFKLISLI